MAKGSGNEDSSEMIIILAGVSIFAFSMLYNKYFAEIAEAWRWLRIGQFYLFAWIPDWVPIFGKLDFAGTIEYLKVTPGEYISSDFIRKVDVYYGKYLSWIPAIILGVLGFKLLNKTENVSRVYDMESLLKDRAPNYPFIQKFVDNHPEDKDIYYERGSKDSKDYAAAMSPKHFAEMKPPLGLEKMARKDKELRKSSIWDGDVGFDYDLAERAFKSQLGRKYEGLSSLNETEMRLYKELKKRIKSSLSRGSEFIDSCVRHVFKGKTPSGLTDTEKKIFNRIKEEVEKASKGKKAKKQSEMLRKPYFLSIFKTPDIHNLFIDRFCEEIMGNHAYIRTGLMSMLAETRNAGVVASLEFRHWLKGEDRILWYCVSTVGRKVSFVECGGVFAHWLVEKELSRPVPQIFVDEAIVALQEAIKLEERIQLKEEEEKNAGF